MIPLTTSLKYYKKREIQEAIVEHSKDREVASRFNESFGARPNTLNYPQDVFEEAKKGATSFHASEERWNNPLNLSPSMNRKELDDIRIGFDLVLDIDCAALEYSKIAADLVIQALQHFKINSISVKFSGNKGFHIGVPFEAFPDKIYGKSTNLLFPEVPRKVAFYLREMIREPLADRILKQEKDVNEIAKKVKKEFADIVKGKKLDVESFLVIDTVLISSRHLYRMPYSFNEKSGFISIPVDPNKIMEFDINNAKPENVVVSRFKFLEREKAVKGEANALFEQSFSEMFKIEEQKEKFEEKEFEIPENAIPEKFFPPCIHKILTGMEDGKKRGLFILINFLTSVGWSHEQIEERLKEWNKMHREPLREVYLLGQLRYHKQQKKKILPPNCSNRNYYEDLRVKCSPEICNRYKNPVNYALKTVKAVNTQNLKRNTAKPPNSKAGVKNGTNSNGTNIKN